MINSPHGFKIPLSQLADISTVEGPVQFNFDYGQRRIVIECNIGGKDIGGFVSEAKRKIKEAVNLSPGYYLTWGGQFENQQRAMRRLQEGICLEDSIIRTCEHRLRPVLMTASITVFSLIPLLFAWSEALS